jgi:taurine--2-oxoglutarate transaminase
MIGWMSHLVLAPPLILTEGQLDDCIAALDEALKIPDAQARG